MPLIFFLRHGETDWNAEHRIQGQQDIPLNSTGRVQAARNGRALRAAAVDPAGLDFVTSPLARATETMEIVRAELSLPRAGYRTDARLMEMHFGDWEGHIWPDLRQRLPDETGALMGDRWSVRAPGEGGENLATVAARVMACFAEFTRDTVVVAHGGPMRCIRAVLEQLTPEALGTMPVPQDKVLRIDGTILTWI